jgi:hypothetical protein
MILCLMTLQTFAQDNSSSPAQGLPDASKEAQDPIKVSVEEVRIPLAAYDEDGRFDSTVEIDDLLVREDGAAQPIKSIYRIPASIVLLLDTGGESNLAKGVRLTREVDSQYVITYKPERPLDSATASEYRRIDVISRRVGLKLRVRRGYVARSGS